MKKYILELHLSFTTYFLIILVQIKLNCNAKELQKDHNRTVRNLFAYGIQDPRKNTSLYDILLDQNYEYGAMIGSVNQVLLKKSPNQFNSKPNNLLINKYKLIYYSPQLIPSQNHHISSLEDISKLSESFEPIFEVDQLNGSIYIKTPSSEPTLEYLCLKRKYCSCFSCIFSLNVIYSTENKINAETIRVFIDDHNDHAPVFDSSRSVINVSISESSQIGDIFKLNDLEVMTSDADAYYNKISFFLTDQNMDGFASRKSLVI
jgi:hypothetical protein